MLGSSDGGRGAWIRSTTAVTGRCILADASEKLRAQKRSKVACPVWDCPSGSFWDGYNGGACYKCPDGYPEEQPIIAEPGACATVIENDGRFVKYNGCPMPDATR